MSGFPSLDFCLFPRIDLVAAQTPMTGWEVLAVMQLIGTSRMVEMMLVNAMTLLVTFCVIPPVNPLAPSTGTKSTKSKIFPMLMANDSFLCQTNTLPAVEHPGKSTLYIYELA